MLLVVREELGEVEARHPVHRAEHVERVDQVALDAGDVGDGEVGEGAVLEGRFGGVGRGGAGSGQPRLEHVAGDHGFGDEVGVGEFDAWRGG